MHTMKDTEPPNELTDEALLNAIAGGAVWAMESLYERYSRILYSLAYRMVADHQVAEDLLQDAFLSVWRRATSTASPDVWDEAWRSVKSSHVRAALMKIPTEQRLVIELAYFQGWTHTEIAEGTQIPLGTVKARMRLGLSHLKQVLIRMGMDET